MKLIEFIERFGSLDDPAFRAGFGHPFLLQEGKLKVEGGKPVDRQVFLLRPPASGKLIVGRSPSADVSIPDSQVSSKHAELSEQDGRWLITDVNSTNGTFIEGKKLPFNTAHPLSDTLPVRFGPDAAFMFLTASSFLPIFRRIQEKLTVDEPLRAQVLDAETEHAGIPVRRIHEQIQADAVRRKSGGDLFICCEGMDAVRLDPGRPVILGRSPGHATMVLPHGEVSRAHVEIARVGAGATIRDLGSANGTFLCGVRLGSSAVDLPVGKAVTIGPFTITLQGPPSEAGLTVQVDGALLRGASGDFSTTPLADVLQEIEAEQKTGVLEVFGQGVVGRVSFRAGHPCNAKTDDGKGGEDAIRALLSVKVGTFTLKSDASAIGPQRIERAFSDILLDEFLGS